MTTPPKRTTTTILLALSGPSSSGKTTIARLLHRTILPHNSSTLLHLDDFYLPESQLPLRNGLVDWDSASSLDLDGLQKTLAFIREHGRLPDDFVSKEDSNAVGDVPVEEAVIEELAGFVESWFSGEGDDDDDDDDGGGMGMRMRKKTEKGRENVHVVLVDGFLLLGQSIPQVKRMFDVKILLRASFSEAKARREARQGYATIEGWWQDPPGYVEDVVWPGFVEEHGYLFVDGDVEGAVDEEVTDREGIQVGPWGSLEVGLRWVVKTVLEGVEEKLKKEKG